MSLKKEPTNVISRIFHSELSGGIVLFTAGLLAIAAVNSPAYTALYDTLLKTPVGLVVGAHTFSFSAQLFINDALMAVFFLLVGLEIKRELLDGELANRKSAILPLIAAVGGMALPALIYTAFNHNDPIAMRGWAIPTATDIAFSLGVLSLLGKRVPLSLKIFLTAVAVIDDLGAIVIIAIFYSSELKVSMLMLAIVVFVYLLALNKQNVTARAPYVLGFIVLWVLVLKSGIHPTIAGVATAFAIPYRTTGDRRSLLLALESDLHFIVTFFILPIFAFANAGINFHGLTFSSLLGNLPMGTAMGLLFGKIIGITGAVWLAIRMGLSHLPTGCNWMSIISVSFLCGIGFTVSLFIGNLAFTDDALINQVKLGVVGGSFISGVVGYLVLRFVAFPKSSDPHDNNRDDNRDDTTQTAL